MYDLVPYVDRCALICLETLTRRCCDVCVMFVFDVLSGRVGSLNLWSLDIVIAPHYPIRCGDFLRIDFHRTTYGVHKPLNDVDRHFNEVAGQFLNRLRSVL
jgi:hypothetical protein